MTTPDLNIVFKLLENNSEKNFFKAEIIILNLSAVKLKNWKLCLNHFRPGDTEPLSVSCNSSKDVKIVKNIGEYYELQGLTEIDAYGSLVIEVTSNWIIKNYSDTPSCYFFVLDNGKQVIDAEGSSDLSLLNSCCSCCSGQNMSAQESNQLKMIPLPKEYSFTGGYVNLSELSDIKCDTNNNELRQLIHNFNNNFRPIIKHPFALANSSSKLQLELKECKGMETDSYTLKVTNDTVELNSGSSGGFLYGMITLVRLINSYNGKVPSLIIKDRPEHVYRGVLLDVARNFRTVEEVKKYLTMMALYKLNVFHCRLTDDEGWRFEVKQYPNITEKGAFRGYECTLPSFHGSGSAKSGGYYTHEDISELIDFANNLNITFIPEIVVPSHSRALIESFADFEKVGDNPLRDKNDTSLYLTPQGFNDNILNPGIEFTFEILESVYSELTKLFKPQQQRNMPFSDFIHVGVDEVPEGAWLNSPICKTLMQNHGLNTTEQLQFYFIERIVKFIKKLGFKAAGWEEIIKGGELSSKDMMVYSWQGESIGRAAAEKGFSVVMTPANYLYFDLAYSEQYYEPGLYWAGYVDCKKIYSYNSKPEGMSENYIKNLSGVQACMWSEKLGYPRYTDLANLPENYIKCPHEYMSFPKMTAFSETAWTNHNRKDWNCFRERLKKETLFLSQFNIKHRKINI